MSGYKTEQKKILLDFMLNNRETPLTIEELIALMQSSDSNSCVPGRSTIYRLMNKLVEDGTVKRFVQGNSRHFYYQIVSSEHCHHHIHMKCTSCGKLYHMDDEDSKQLLGAVLKNTHFKVNQEETTLYGTCDTCDVAHV